MPRLFLYSLSIFLFCHAGCFSQRPDFLSGKLIDSDTDEPVVFATIRVKNRAIGVISNMDGGFSIPQKFKAYGDTLEISSMGFQNRQILISNLAVDRVHTIYLEPALFELEEAIVKGKRKRKLSAKQIIRKAIENIPNNYPQDLFSTVGYYRDYQLKNGSYVNLNEAVLEVFDQGFSQVDTATTKIRLYDYKKNTDFERDTLADNPYDYERLQKIIDNAFLRDYGGNEFVILRVHDAIRNYNLSSYSFVDRFDRDLLQNHSFTRHDHTYINGEAVYTLKFRKSHPNYTAHGVLHISQGDFAIHKMEYTLYDRRKHRPDGTLNRHYGRGRLLFEVISEYRRKYNRMYLNYISFHNSFIIWEPPKFKIDSIMVDLKKAPFVDFRLKLAFNKIPNAEEAVDLKNYSVKYKGRRLKIGAAGHSKNIVFLLPDITQKKRMAMLEKIIDAARKNRDLKELLSVDVRPIHDIEGDTLHKWLKRDYNQFREYFVQQVKPNSELPEDGKYMNKRKPIFKGQPIVRPDNFSDYWMNTPLKASESKNRL